jgi:hypothetical protein
MTKTIEPNATAGQAPVIHCAKESIRRAMAVPCLRKRVFILNIPALSFGFVSDFVLRI